MSAASSILLMSLCLAHPVSRLLGQDGDRAAKSQPSTPAHTGYHGPLTLGPFSMEGRFGALNLRKLCLLLGNPRLPAKAYAGDTICFRDMHSGSYLVVEIGADDPRLVRGLTLSRVNVCPSGIVSSPSGLSGRMFLATGFSTWATQEGVRLGSSIKRVLARYGKPTSTEDTSTLAAFSPYGMNLGAARPSKPGRILSYLPKQGAADTSHAFFGVRGGIVVWMTVSDNE